MIKICYTLAATLLLIFALSFLLDLPFINTNWLRYTVVVFLAIAVFAFGLKIVWQLIKELKGEIGNE